MKSKIIFATFIIILILSVSCTKEKLDNIEYFAFGSATDFCLNNCADFFMIKDGNIYPDDMDHYNGSTLAFKTDALPNEKYNLVKNLIDRFPKYLINKPNKIFGCPDCADQGGIHIEIKENGQIIRWHIDTNISNTPTQIQDYVEDIEAIIEQLN